MSKTTTTIFEIIKSELINSGKNEFYNNGQLSFFNDEFSFIKKIMKYDNDVKLIVDNKFFQGFKFTGDSVDTDFKKMFVNKFLDREIQQQTLESFSAKVLYTSLRLSDFIENVFTNLSEYMQGNSQSRVIGDNESSDEFRSAYSSLPQNEINLNVENTELSFADNNNISKGKSKGKDERTTTNKNYNADNLQKTMNIIDTIFIEFDKACFLQIW